jgi:hypothetical protein
LSDKKRREGFRQFVRDSSGRLQNVPGDGSAESGAPGGIDWDLMRRELEKIPMPFIRPDLAVHRDELDTPEEVEAFKKKHGLDDLGILLAQEAFNYGGLAFEPTPFGTRNQPGKGLEWKRKSHEPGEVEQGLRKKYANGGTPTPQELALVAQERQMNFRLEDPMGIWRPILRGASMVPFAIAGGMAGGSLLGPLLAGGMGGLGMGAGPAAAIGGGVGSGIGAGATTGALSGDPDNIWKGALVGGATGGVGGGVGALTSNLGPVASGGITGTATGLTGGLGQSALTGDFDLGELLLAAGAGGVTGATGGLLFPGRDPASKLGRQALGKGFNLGTALLDPNDPLAGANAQLDQAELDRAKQMQDAMVKAQEEWKRRMAEGAAAQRAAMLAAQREWQMQWEARRAEYEAKLQAFITEREAQIDEALRAMGVGEGGIGALLAERQAALDAQRQAAEESRQQMIASRDFFPSTLLSEQPVTGEFAPSSVLVPHSPPPVQFGAEGLPASFASYGTPPTPEFSAEGFLPSGSLAGGEPPPSVAPMRAGRRRYSFPTLLGGLTRSPYLMRA